MVLYAALVRAPYFGRGLVNAILMVLRAIPIAWHSVNRFIGKWVYLRTTDADRLGVIAIRHGMCFGQCSNTIPLGLVGRLHIFRKRSSERCSFGGGFGL